MSLHKKIIISANSAWNVVNFRKGIVLELINHGFEVVVVSPKDEYVAKLCDLGCQHINIDIDNKGINPINDLYLIFQYLKIFYQFEPNVILTYTIKPNIYGSLSAYILSIPIVNNISGLGTAFIKGGLLGNIVNFLYKISLRKSEHVFFQNYDDENLFLKKNLVTKDQVSVLPGSGVNLEYYQPQKSNIFNKDQGEFIFLLIARLIWDKGIQEYVSAARIVKEYSPTSRFQILGFLGVDNQTAVPRSQVDLWVTEGVIEYIGVAKDVRPYIDSSNCVVLPSYREGVPKTLLEAAAMGRPIITTKVEGCKEVVDDGVNGYLCNARDDKDLAEKMKIMLTTSSKDIVQMGLSGRKKMEKEFDEKIVINMYLLIVNKIIDGQ
jgi:glycosyltransferase involved in cell wall biosynthesis